MQRLSRTKFSPTWFQGIPQRRGDNDALIGETARGELLRAGFVIPEHWNSARGDSQISVLGWQFWRSDCHWGVSGPGIPTEYAELFYQRWKGQMQIVHCADRPLSPIEAFGTFSLMHCDLLSEECLRSFLGLLRKIARKAALMPRLARPVEPQRTCFPALVDYQVSSKERINAELIMSGITHAELKPWEKSPHVHLVLYNWFFRRTYQAWRVSGPGIPLDFSEQFHQKWKQAIRLDGTQESPRALYQGFPVPDFELLTKECLKAFVAMLREVGARSLTPQAIRLRSKGERK